MSHVPQGGDSDAAFSTINAAALKGGVKAAAVKDAKEEAAAAKEKNKERVLSPRSWQLKEMAEREAVSFTFGLSVDLSVRHVASNLPCLRHCSRLHWPSKRGRRISAVTCRSQPRVPPVPTMC